MAPVTPGPKAGAELAEHALKMARAGLDAAAGEALLAARSARNAGMSTDAIAHALAWSRSTLWRRMNDAGYWP